MTKLPVSLSVAALVFAVACGKKSNKHNADATPDQPQQEPVIGLPPKPVMPIISVDVLRQEIAQLSLNRKAIEQKVSTLDLNAEDEVTNATRAELFALVNKMLDEDIVSVVSQRLSKRDEIQARLNTESAKLTQAEKQVSQAQTELVKAKKTGVAESIKLAEYNLELAKSNLKALESAVAESVDSSEKESDILDTIKAEIDVEREALNTLSSKLFK